MLTFREWLSRQPRLAEQESRDRCQVFKISDHLAGERAAERAERIKTLEREALEREAGEPCRTRWNLTARLIAIASLIIVALSALALLVLAVWCWEAMPKGLAVCVACAGIVGLLLAERGRK